MGDNYTDNKWLTVNIIETIVWNYLV